MAKLSFKQLESLWIQAGGSKISAPTAAAVALAESGGNTAALNNNSSSGDYSVGLWQINYYGSLGPSRAARYGQPDQLRADPYANARAAIDLSRNGSNWSPWSTFTSGAYLSHLPSTRTGGAAGAQIGQGAAGQGASLGGIIGNPSDILKGIQDVTGNPKKDPILGPLFSTGEFLGKLTDPKYILRGLQIVAGGAMVLVGVTLLVRQVGLPTTYEPAPDLSNKAKREFAQAPGGEDASIAQAAEGMDTRPAKREDLRPKPVYSTRKRNEGLSQTEEIPF
jgi:hypothetical protein